MNGISPESLNKKLIKVGVCLTPSYSFVYMYIYIKNCSLLILTVRNFMCLPHIFPGCQDVRF